MATTRLENTVPVKSFTALVEAKLVENNKFRQSGVVGTDPRVTQKANTSGLEVSLREWKRPAGGAATTQSDNPTNRFVPAGVSQNAMIARMISRTLGFSAMDIADFVSDADAIAYATGEFARLRVADEESVVLDTLTGVLADNVANDSGDMLKNLSITTGTIGDANKFGGAALIAGRQTMGDRGGDLKVLVMHSDVVNARRAAESNAFVPASKTDIGLETYMGIPIIETDNVGKGGTGSFPIYTSYFCGLSLFAYASAPVERALVTVRDELAGYGSGEETILNRFRYLLPIIGYTNKEAPVNGVSQDRAELQAAATWDRVLDRKAIPLVAIKTNG